MAALCTYYVSNSVGFRRPRAIVEQPDDARPALHQCPWSVINCPIQSLRLLLLYEVVP